MSPQFALSFGEAHETTSEVPLETEMDLFNNNIGVQIAITGGYSSSIIGINSFINAVESSLLSGQMKYICSGEIRWSNQ
jgi:nitrous oxidase accessory protein NosD